MDIQQSAMLCLTWNVAGAMELFTKDRIHRAMTKVKEKDPNIVLLQEFPPSLLDDLRKEFPKYHCKWRRVQNNCPCLVTLLKKECFPLIDGKNFHTPCILPVQATDHSGSPWQIFNCHLKATVKQKRQTEHERRVNAFQLILAKLDKNSEIIIGGDMNIHKDEKSDDCLIQSHIRDAWALSPEGTQQKYPHTLDLKVAWGLQKRKLYAAERFDRIYYKSQRYSLKDYKHFGMERGLFRNAAAFVHIPCSDHCGVAVKLIEESPASDATQPTPSDTQPAPSDNQPAPSDIQPTPSDIKPTPSDTQQIPITEPLTVTTWNLNGEKWYRFLKKRLSTAIMKIKEHDPDVVLLQEVPCSLLDDLKDLFDQDKYECRDNPPMKNTKFRLVTLLKKDTFSIDMEKPTCTKDNRFLAIHVTYSGSSWEIINCHLKSNVVHKRTSTTPVETRTTALKNLLEKLCSKENVIIGGDMNILEGEASDQGLLNANFMDTWSRSPQNIQEKYPFTYDQIKNATVAFDAHMGIKEDTRRDPPARFDRIYIKSSRYSAASYKHFGMEMEAMAAAHPVLVANVQCSDHYGVVVQLIDNHGSLQARLYDWAKKVQANYFIPANC